MVQMPIASMYGLVYLYTYVYQKNNQMWVKPPYMDGMSEWPQNWWMAIDQFVVSK